LQTVENFVPIDCSERLTHFS